MSTRSRRISRGVSRAPHWQEFSPSSSPLSAVHVTQSPNSSEQSPGGKQRVTSGLSYRCVKRCGGDGHSNYSPARQAEGEDRVNRLTGRRGRQAGRYQVSKEQSMEGEVKGGAWQGRTDGRGQACGRLRALDWTPRVHDSPESSSLGGGECERPTLLGEKLRLERRPILLPDPHQSPPCAK